MCPKCSARVLFCDDDGRWCLTCSWREPTTVSKDDAGAGLKAARARSGNTDNYRRYGTHAHKTLNRYEEL